VVGQQIEQGLALDAKRHARPVHVRLPARGFGASQRLVDADAVARLRERGFAAGDRLERQVALEQDVDGRSVALAEEEFAFRELHLVRDARQQRELLGRRA
jgi:hypothetical protein